jgi:hypothetical protein
MMKLKMLILSLLSLLVAFGLAANSTTTISGLEGYTVVTNWGFVFMSAIFTLAGVVGIGHTLLKSQNKSDK